MMCGPFAKYLQIAPVRNVPLLLIVVVDKMELTIRIGDFGRTRFWENDNIIADCKYKGVDHRGEHDFHLPTSTQDKVYQIKQISLVLNMYFYMHCKFTTELSKEL